MKRAGVALVLVALSTSACASAVAGRGALDARLTRAPSTAAPPRTTAPTTAPPTAPPLTTAPAPATGAPTSRALLKLLEPAPPGSVPWHQAWARNQTPTIGQFVARFYAKQYAASVEAELRALGLVAIAHRAWIAHNDDQCDVVLLGFQQAAGATERYVTAVHAKTASPGVRTFSITPPAGALATGTYETRRDDQGYIRSIVYGEHGNVVMEQFGFTKPKVQPTELGQWAATQLARLP
jgi:hypothetical protein